MRLMSKIVVGVCAALPLAGVFIGTSLAATPQEVAENAPAQAWRSIDPENTLYMDLPSGRIVIELQPDFAPKHVERLKTLTRAGFYDGIMFHRVIEGFMAQGGDPTGTGRGSSDLPDLPGEFIREAAAVSGFTEIGRDSRASRVGFIGAIPVAGEPETLKEFLNGSDIAFWGLHCKGIMSMARSEAANSANSQFFLMFGDSRQALDQRYTIWGRIVDGYENARRINRGEPPERPTPIVRVRVASDVPDADRQQVEVMRTDSETFQQYLSETKAVSETGFVKDICNINIPARIDGRVDL